MILPVRKVPLALKEPLKKEIDRLVDLGILKPVDTPTDLVSSMVVVSKSNGKIRHCIDPKPLNQALRRNHYPLPEIDDLLPELSKAKACLVWSMLRMDSGIYSWTLRAASLPPLARHGAATVGPECRSVFHQLPKSSKGALIPP